MTEAEWLAGDDPRPMLVHHANASGRRKPLHFAVRNLRRSEGSLGLTDQELEWLAAVVEDFGEGRITAEEVNRVAAALTDGPTFKNRVLDVLVNGLPIVLAVFTVDWAAGLKRTFFAPDSITRPDELPLQADLVRCVFGNPFRPVAFSPEWRTATATALARQMYESRDFSEMPILADALLDAGCDDEDVLNHCREPGPHVRGCWVVDLVLGKE